MRMIPASVGDQPMNIAQALSAVLKNLTLKENGTASATYVAPEGNTVTSPEKYAFYAPMPNGAAATKGAVLAFPNVADIVTGAMTAPNAVKSDMDVLMSLLPDVLAFAAPMLKSGLPVMYEKNEQITTMYLGKDVFIGILKLFSTLYKKEGIEAFIEGKIYAMMLEQYKIEIAAKAATAGAMLVINGFVDNVIPANINALDEVKVGLNFTQAK